MHHLYCHTTRPNVGENKGSRVQKPDRGGVGEATEQFGSGGRAGGAFNRGKGTSQEGTVVSCGSLKGPGVFAWYRRAVGPVAEKMAVHGVPYMVLQNQTKRDKSDTTRARYNRMWVGCRTHHDNIISDSESVNCERLSLSSTK